MARISLIQKVTFVPAAVLLIIVAAFLVTFRDYRKDLEFEIMGNLNDLIAERTGLFLMYLEMNTNRIKDFSTDGYINERAALFLQRKTSDQVLSEYLRDKKLPVYDSIYRLDVASPDGVIMASTHTAALGMDVSKEHYFIQGKMEAHLTERKDGYLMGPELAVSAPIYRENRVVGVISGYIPLSRFVHVFEREDIRRLGAFPLEVERRTLELYIVNKDKHMVTQSRFIKDSARKIMVDTPPVRACLERGINFTGGWKDYRGVEVEGSSICFPSLGWTLIAEMDKDEIFAPIRDTIRYAATTVFVAIVLMGALTAYFLKAIIIQIRRLATGAAEISSGNYDIHIPVRTADEIGILAGSFNEMARQIKKRTEDLVRSEASLTNAQRIGHMGNWDWDIANDTLYWSAEIYRIFGVEPRKFGATYDAFLSFVHPEDRTLVERAVDEALHKKKPYSIDHRVIVSGGERLLHEEGEVAFDNGKPVRMSGTVQDITEMRRAEEALRRSEERYRLLLESLQEGVWVIDRDANTAYVNPKMAEMLGYKVEEMIGKSFFDFMDEQRVEIARGHIDRRKAGIREQHDFEFLKKGGGFMYATLGAAPIFDERNDYAGSINAVIDITEKRMAEEERKRLNIELEKRVEERTAELNSALKELETFSYSVAHDLRTPLRLIDGFSSVLMKRCGNLDKESSEYLSRIRDASARMSRLIDDILELSRLSRAEMRHQEIDISLTAETIAIELQKAEPERKAEFKIESGLKAVGDAVLIRAVLENLIGNAWKFAAKREVTKIEVGSMGREGGKTVFFIRDNGAGFDMSFAHKLFTPFQRLHPADEFPGTGVGLATVQRIIQRHGGRIWAEGEVDRGATFYFTL